MLPFIKRHADKILGVISCFDRILVTGTFPQICHAQAMASHLTAEDVRLFDYPLWAEPLREMIRTNADKMAAAQGVTIEFISRSKEQRKEDIIRDVLASRGEQPGLVHILSAMESCPSFRPWHDKATGRTFLKPKDGRCLHYYFYFIDAELGLCFLRVPTWAPFRLQFYCNGHNILARQLEQAGIAYTMSDNAFSDIADFPAAQRLADQLKGEDLHRKFDHYARMFCPVFDRFTAGCHWSMTQTEYSTDIVFRDAAMLEPIYKQIVYTAIHAVKAGDIATFLGRRITGNFEGEVGNDFHTRIEGTRIRHHFGRSAIKMYDKRGHILRIETTTNDVSIFRHYRKVEHRDGSSEMKMAPMAKTIYSIGALREALAAANRRYIDFIGAIDDHTPGQDRLEKIAQPVRQDDRSWRGFNFFLPNDLDLFAAIMRPEFAIGGFTNHALQAFLQGKTCSQVGRMLQRLRTHHLIKKAVNSYKYHLTSLGRLVIASGLKLRELVIIPSLTQPTVLS
ncbi:MAG: MarR family transcriptional regulator [Magnetococcales bacterium]|nr:MarR family transcriptional regulator [Magnetococcales bacterium]